MYVSVLSVICVLLSTDIARICSLNNADPDPPVCLGVFRTIVFDSFFCCYCLIVSEIYLLFSPARRCEERHVTNCDSWGLYLNILNYCVVIIVVISFSTKSTVNEQINYIIKYIPTVTALFFLFMSNLA